MSSVDDRIVNMTFNNKQFESGAAQSMKTLTNLEKTVASSGKGKGLESMGQSVQAVSTKFSALQIAGVAALGTIVAKATSAGISMLKSFTIAPIMDGFNEYKTGLDSVQTIMGNTGKSVKVVNRSLDELNAYSDQTIYNFGQMAKNIGTFTAAGVELDTAVSAIKGISNLAALSGSSSQQASTAMYQLSQAISAGRVSLQDWNSVVNAGMAGKQFKTALSRTAVAMGELDESAVKVGTDVKIMGQSFRQSISAAAGQESWLSSEILVSTLATLDGRFSKTKLKIEGYNTAQERNAELTKERIALEKEGIKYTEEQWKAVKKQAEAAFTAATQIKSLPQLIGVIRESMGSMFAGAFEIILGDFDQSKKLWTKVGNVITGPEGIIAGMSSSFLGTLRMWEKEGGRAKIIHGLSRVFRGLGKILNTVKLAFRDVFPPGASDVLMSLTKGFHRFTKMLRPSEETLDSLRSIFGGVFAILHIGITIMQGVAKAFAAFFGALFEGSEAGRGGILSLIGSIGDVIIAFDKWLTSGGKVQSFFAGIGTLAGAFIKPILTAIGLVIDGFSALVSGEGLGGAMAKFGEAKTIFSDFVTGVITGLDQLTSPFDGLKSKIADLARTAVKPFEGFIDALERARIQVVEGLGLDTVMPTLDGAETVLKRIRDRLIEFGEGFSIASIPLDNFGNAIDFVIDKVQTLIDKLDISNRIESIKDAVSGLFDSMQSSGGAAASSGTSAMTAGAEATTSAFEKLKSVMSTIASAVGSVLGFLGDAAAKIAGKVAGLFPNAPLEWATAVNVLISGALIKKLFFSKGVFGELADAISKLGDGITKSFDQLTSSLKTMQNSIRAEMIKNIAIGVALLAASLVALSFVPAEKLGMGLGAITTLMAELVLMLLALSKIDADMKVSVIAASLVLIATSVAILTGAVAALGSLPIKKLEQGLSGMGLALGILLAGLMALALGTNEAELAGAAGAMILMATALNILVIAVSALGALPLETLEQGLSGMGLALGILVAAVMAMGLSGTETTLLAAGGAMILMATALNMLIVPITALGLLPWEVVSQGLQAISMGIIAMTLSLVLLAGAGPSVLAAGAAMVMMATALNLLVGVILALGAAPLAVVEQGLKAFGLALLMIVVAALAASMVLPGMAALSTVILSMGAAVLMAGAGVALFASGLALLAAVGAAAVGVITLAVMAFIALLPNIAVQVAAAFVSFIQAIALAAPKIRKAMGTIISSMLGTVTDAIPEIGAVFSALIQEGLRILGAAVGDFIELGFTIIDEFLKSAAAHAPSIADSVTILVTTFLESMGDNVDELALAGAQLIIDTLNGLSAAIDERGDEIAAAAGKLATTFVTELTNALRSMISNIDVGAMIPDVDWGFLPGVSKKSAKDLKGGGMNAYNLEMERAVDPIERLRTLIADIGVMVTNALTAANKFLVARDTTGLAAPLAAQATKEQGNAYAAQGRANIQNSYAAQAEKKVRETERKAQKEKDKKEKKELERRAARQQKAADTQRRIADRKQANADKAQAIADAKAQKVLDALAFSDADSLGRGDIRSQQGQDLADRAQEFLAKANAEMAEADRIAKKAGKETEQSKKLRDQAKKHAKDAKQYADDSEAAFREAEGYYITARAAEQAEAARLFAEAMAEVVGRISTIKLTEEEKAAQRAWDDAFEKASTADRITMLQKLFDEQNAEVAKYTDLAVAKLAQADAAVAAGADPADIQNLVDEAERFYALADQARSTADSAEDRLEQEKEKQKAEEEKRLADEKKAAEDKAQADAAGGSTDTIGSSFIGPSRTAVEDAAKAIDRYTESLRQAEESASASQSVVQFVQNNTSPVALSPSEIYRQSKNLLTMQEVKMGAP